jgi:hypothetical protein
MDPADSDFLKVLFRENNDLRLKLSAAQRQIFNKTAQCEALEEDLRNNVKDHIKVIIFIFIID